MCNVCIHIHIHYMYYNKHRNNLILPLHSINTTLFDVDVIFCTITAFKLTMYVKHSIAKCMGWLKLQSICAITRSPKDIIK